MLSENAATMLLIQLGVGHVGSAVAALIEQRQAGWRDRFGIALRHFAFADSSGFVTLDSSDAPMRILTARAGGKPLSSLPDGIPWEGWREVLEWALQEAGTPERVIVADCAVGRSTSEMLLAVRAGGAHVVLCNKDSLIGPHDQFSALQGDGQRGSLRLSATVGAGLPITSMVAAAHASGDTIHTLSAVASGSLGQLCDAMSSGVSFPDALQSAIDAHYCEPDPRIDLSGHDVARKLLILARLAGWRVELTDVAVESLIPPGSDSFSRETFLASLPSWHDHLADRFAAAQVSRHVMRYVGSMDGDGKLRASLRSLSPDDPLARGRGPENVFVLRTERYQQHPLVISGPGAGISVTAGAVVGDILRAAGVL